MSKAGSQKYGLFLDENTLTGIDGTELIIGQNTLGVDFYQNGA